MPKALAVDIDGTLTDEMRRLSLRAVAELRHLIDAGVPVVLASGNTVCFLDALGKMIGTNGDVIAENGGVYRMGFTGEKHISGDRSLCLAGYRKVVEELKPESGKLRLYSSEYRFSDVAFARDADPLVVKRILAGTDIQVIDTGFAIHLQPPGLSKGRALGELAKLMGLALSDFLVIGDSVNDVSMLQIAGVSAVPANAAPEAKAVADFVMDASYGDGTTDAILQYFG
jgi:phosphoglycolate phosphatase (TIGR01487 family)